MNYEKNTVPISQWAESDRPREKLMALGKNALTDAELIAILLRSGTKKYSAVDLAKMILAQSENNLIELSKLSVNDLMKFPGIAEAKALSIVSALELGRRRREAEVLVKKRIACSRDVFEYMQTELADIRHEEFWVLLLNRASQVIRKSLVSEGGLVGTVADPRRIFKLALEYNATSVVLCHNHPSGQVNPSEEDIRLTKRLKEAGNFLEIPVIDHIIIGEETYFSFADEGLI